MQTASSHALHFSCSLALAICMHAASARGQEVRVVNAAPDSLVAAPVVIRAIGPQQTVSVPDATQWAIGTNGLAVHPMRDVCSTPCTLFAPLGRLALSLRGVDGTSSHVVDVTPRGASIEVRTSTVFHTGVAMALASVAIEGVSLAMVIAGSDLGTGTCGSTSDPACSIATIGGAGLVIGLVGLVASIVPLAIGRSERFAARPLARANTPSVEFARGALRF